MNSVHVYDDKVRKAIERATKNKATKKKVRQAPMRKWR